MGSTHESVIVIAVDGVVLATLDRRYPPHRCTALKVDRQRCRRDAVWLGAENDQDQFCNRHMLQRVRLVGRGDTADG